MSLHSLKCKFDKFQDIKHKSSEEKKWLTGLQSVWTPAHWAFTEYWQVAIKLGVEFHIAGDSVTKSLNEQISCK